jgi:hypothetical protein
VTLKMNGDSQARSDRPRGYGGSRALHRRPSIVGTKLSISAAEIW